MGSFANNLFWVDDGILRGEAAEVIVKAEGGARTGEAEAVFTDIPLNHPYAFWISEAFRKHLLYGMSDQKRLYDPDRFMTRAEAAMLFGRDPKVEEEMYLLLDMNKGFGEKAFCPINSAPLVTQVKADPSTVYVGEQKVVVLTAVVIDRQGLEDLSNVTVDLTGIGGPPDATMFDDATNGDEEKNNGIFSLRILVNPTKTGDIFFKVRAVDRYTFEGFGETKIMVLE
jgi:hypothetical protein